MLKTLLRPAHLLFAILLLIHLLPNRTVGDNFPLYVIIPALALEAAVWFAAWRLKKSNADLYHDIACFIYFSLIAWILLTAKSNFLRPGLFPPPGAVFAQLLSDHAKVWLNIRTSLGIILQGYLLGVAVAVPLGLFLGWSVRFGNAATYIGKFLGAIPPVVYIPYGIALLPTFRSASVMVIFLAAFWPALASTMSGVLNVERRIIDAAKSLNVGKTTMLFQIILPAALPEIFIGCNQGLGVSFILLTAAEMIGARSGMGYYVKNYSDLGDYTRTIAGVIVIGVVVTAMVFFVNKLQRYLLRWKR
ncbi:MAG: ABC transporter permease subunit [Planctomycetota bacterium]|jgi:NitT/TauT family transport system permease protein|nr:ABC transporter permease subunit [Planctomycetota bacterium]